MAQYYTVSKAFQSTNKETKQPELDDHGNTTWLFQVEGQTAPGWMRLRRKPGGELKPGEKVYGIVDTWDDGKAKFVRQQPPQDGNARAHSAAPRQVQQNSGGEVIEKLDYIISILENFLRTQSKSTTGERPVSEDIEDDFSGPVDLDSVPY